MGGMGHFVVYVKGEAVDSTAARYVHAVRVVYHGLT